MGLSACQASTPQVKRLIRRYIVGLVVADKKMFRMLKMMSMGQHIPRERGLTAIISGKDIVSGQVSE